MTKIDIFFLDKLLHVFELEQELATHVGDVDVLKEAKRNGFSDRKIADLWNQTADQVRATRLENNIVPVYKMVDTCAAEFESSTPYFYSTYEWENESIKSDKESVIVLGSGPIRIGQGVEFDYATVHSVKSYPGCRLRSYHHELLTLRQFQQTSQFQINFTLNH